MRRNVGRNYICEYFIFGRVKTYEGKAKREKIAL